eukprot:3570199-Prymnesium_polylepis.1
MLPSGGALIPKTFAFPYSEMRVERVTPVTCDLCRLSCAVFAVCVPRPFRHHRLGGGITS